MAACTHGHPTSGFTQTATGRPAIRPTIRPPMSPRTQSDSLLAATTLAVSAGCELDLLDDELLVALDTTKLSMTDICAYLADHRAPLIEILGATTDLTTDPTADPTAEGNTTVIITAGSVGIAWTMKPNRP